MTATKSLITIRLASNYVKIEAEALTGYPFACAIHKRVNKPGWAVAVTAIGIVVVKGKTRVEAIGKLEAVVNNPRQVETVLSTIKSASPLPQDSPLYQAPEPVEGPDVEKIIHLIADRAKLNEDEKKAVRRALSSRGRNAGRLLAKCPSYPDDLAAAAWIGIQPNAFKVSIGRAIFLRGGAKDLLLKLSGHKWPVWFDSDCSALVNLGVW